MKRIGRFGYFDWAEALAGWKLRPVTAIARHACRMRAVRNFNIMIVLGFHVVLSAGRSRRRTPYPRTGLGLTPARSAPIRGGHRPQHGLSFGALSGQIKR